MAIEVPNQEQTIPGSIEQDLSVDSPEALTDIQPDEIAASIDDAISGFSDQQKNRLATMMTPEFALVMGDLFGEAVAGFFSQNADPDVILVPMSRQAVKQKLQGQGQLPAGVAPNPSQPVPTAPIIGA